MNEVQEFILKRAMQKVADAKIPEEYAHDRNLAYWYQDSNDRLLPYQTPGGVYYNGADSMPFTALKNMDITDLPRLRELQARRQALHFGIVPGSDDYNTLVKYLIEQGETNWHNFNKPKNPKPNVKAPTVNNEDGKAIEPKRIQDAGRTMVSNDNYKKFSGNA